jgi:hypothetical protein
MYAAITNSLSADTSGMNGSLDTSCGKNRSIYKAHVFGRNIRYPRNGVRVSSRDKTLLAVSGRAS